ncbi:MAG: transcriptional regulator [Alphaproteobacteria bacterium]|jgi:HTH-type transcriptional regulator/antitoxin HigA
MTHRTPAEVFPPGEYLRDEIGERGWSQTEFAEIIGRPMRVVNEIIAGKVQITPKTATEIAAALGTSPQYWMNLETAYQLGKVEAPPERIAREARLREKFPVKEMIKRGWVLHSNNFEVMESRVLTFFNASNLDAPILFDHAARRNHGEDLSSIQLAWLFRARQIVSALRVPKFSESALRAALAELDLLMAEPDEARHVPRILAECGVRFAIVEPVPGSKIQGVCFWINEGKSPVIALSMKIDRIDNFWFNLRHEIEHVLRGDGKSAAIVDEDPYDLTNCSDPEAEKAANAAAADFCVPASRMDNFIARHDPIFTTVNFLGFSKIVRRHPGIVAGQLHHKLNGRHELFAKYIAKVRDVITQTALTDGYGKSCPVDP